MTVLNTKPSCKLFPAGTVVSSCNLYSSEVIPWGLYPVSLRLTNSSSPLYVFLILQRVCYLWDTSHSTQWSRHYSALPSDSLFVRKNAASPIVWVKITASFGVDRRGGEAMTITGTHWTSLAPWKWFQLQPALRSRFTASLAFSFL